MFGEVARRRLSLSRIILNQNWAKSFTGYLSDTSSENPQRQPEPPVTTENIIIATTSAGEHSQTPNPSSAHEQTNYHAEKISALRRLYSTNRISQEHPSSTDTVSGGATPELMPPAHLLCSLGETSTSLRELMLSALDEKSRSKRLYVTTIMLAFLLLQSSFFFVLLTYVPWIDSPQIIWTCPDDLNSAYYVISCWMGATALLTGIIRTFAESSFVNANEIFYLSPLLSFDSRSTHLTRCEDCSVVIQPPQGRTIGLVSLLVWYLRCIYSILQIQVWYKYACS